MDFILNALHSIGFNWHVALANFINFLIVLFVLNKFVFHKVVKMIKNREDIIKKGLEDASTAQKLLSSATDDSAKILSDAKLEASQNVKDSIEKAKLEAKAIVDKSASEIEMLRTDLKNRINNAEADVTKQFEKIAPSLTANLMSKILKESIDEDMNNKLVAALSK